MDLDDSLQHIMYLQWDEVRYILTVEEILVKCSHNDFQYSNKTPPG